jgi:hypothetical protein
VPAGKPIGQRRAANAAVQAQLLLHSHARPRNFTMLPHDPVKSKRERRDAAIAQPGLVAG